MMEQALRDILLGSGPLAAITGEDVSWIERDRRAFPAITLQLIAGGRTYTHNGPDSLRSGLVQIDAWAKSFAEAKSIAAAVAVELRPVAVSGVEFSGFFLENERQGSEELAGVGRVYRISLDYRIWWKEGF